MKDCEGHYQENAGAEATNIERACCAYVTLCTGGNDHHDQYVFDSVGNAIVDILADLRHLCDVEKLDFAHLDARAYSHYCEENGEKTD